MTDPKYFIQVKKTHHADGVLAKLVWKTVNQEHPIFPPDKGRPLRFEDRAEAQRFAREDLPDQYECRVVSTHDLICPHCGGMVTHFEFEGRKRDDGSFAFRVSDNLCQIKFTQWLHPTSPGKIVMDNCEITEGNKRVKPLVIQLNESNT